MKKFLFLIFALFGAVVSQAQSNDETIIRSILTGQTNAWNRGSVEDFMKGYWNSDSLLFVGRSGPSYGYNTALQNYKKNYKDTVEMGQLSFDIRQVRPIAADHYFVLGRWYLKRTIGDLSGYFTLLFKKINGEWVIISDHSS